MIPSARLALPLALAAAALLAPVHASDAQLDLQTRQFQEDANRIRQELRSGDEKYSQIKSDDRSTVLSLLDRMEKRLVDAGGIDGLSEASKTEVFNDQEQINTLLTRAREDSRMICRREVTTGSHRKQQQCMTVAERRLLREATRETMERSRLGGYKINSD